MQINKGEWISVDYALPNDNKWVACMLTTGAWIRCVRQGGHWYRDNGLLLPYPEHQITHWMELKDA